LDWTIQGVYDIIYQEKSVKRVNIDCSSSSGYDCLAVILIDENGEIMDVY